jgi:hypothetical protein
MTTKISKKENKNGLCVFLPPHHVLLFLLESHNLLVDTAKFCGDILNRMETFFKSQNKFLGSRSGMSGSIMSLYRSNQFNL